MFSCHSRGFCPSCDVKRLEEWGEWMRETPLLNIPHRQVVFTMPMMLRILLRYNHCGLPAKGWVEMIRKVYEVDPVLCPSAAARWVSSLFLPTMPWCAESSTTSS